MLLLYVAGRYTELPDSTRDENIEAARNVAISIWNAGHAAICPHTNTANFDIDCKASYESYLRGDLLMVERCDGLVMVDGWEESYGAVGEKKRAEQLGIPVYFDVSEIPNRKQNAP